MTARVIYQPCSDDVARKNLQTTILNPVQFSDVVDLLEPELREELRAAYPDGKLFIWGLASPKTRNAWLTMQSGDTIIFNTKTVVTVSACFTHRTHNRSLALKLWGWANAETESTWKTSTSSLMSVTTPFASKLFRRISIAGMTAPSVDTTMLKAQRS